MTSGTLKIHSENILPIIKKWLYSDRDIFVRELVSNACDAIQKVKVLRERGETEALDTEFRIDIKIDKEKKTISFIDTGIGMTAEEVEKYIAQIAFSGAEDFVQKYQSKSEQEQLIGHFGLGFFSVYMVAENVEMNTLSYRNDAQASRWSCDGSSDYDLSEGSRTTRGTEITLFIDEDNSELLEEAQLRTIVDRYCSYLPIPIYLNDQQINKKKPLWTKPASECEKKDYIEFYRHLFPMDEEPLFWVHLNVDYPFNLKGILYFPKLSRNHDFNKQQISLYCNRVFVSDNCKDLVPDYLLGLRGIIDSPDIPLNVSRSSLQMDRTVRQLMGHISKKVADSICTLYNTDKQRFFECWKDIELIVKLGGLEDAKFYERIKEILVWRNDKDEWTTAEQYLERNKEKTGDKIYYTADDKSASHFLDLYKEKGIEVLHTQSLIDTSFLPFLESKLGAARFHRIDSSIEDHLLDKTREKSVLDSEGKTEASKLADIFRTHLGKEVDVEAKSLASDHLPGFVMIDENQRRMRDYMMRFNQGDAPLGDFGKKTFVVNTNNPMVTALPKLNDKDPELAKELAIQLYELALLSQREIDPKTLNAFVSRNAKVLAKLTQLATEK